MTDVRTVTWAEHQNKRWVRPASFEFAAKDSVVSVGLHEVARVLMQLPIGFTRNNADEYTPVAIMGLVPGKNLAVSREGQWLADYIPALYRCYPFRMLPTSDGKFHLCVNHESGLVHDAAAGFQFLLDERTPAEETAKVVELLMQLENERILLKKACEILKSQDLVEPWPLQVQTAEKRQPVAGLYRINEAKLGTLPSDALVELRNCGGLVLAYGQLFSMQHIYKLNSLAQRQDLMTKSLKNTSTPALDIVDEQGIVSFANL